MSVTSDLIRIQAMKIYYLLSILIILLAVSSSSQRSIAGHIMEEADTLGLATPWSVEDTLEERRVRRAWSVSGETSDDETMAEATPWP